MTNYCSVCGKQLDSYDINTCLDCREDVCSQDYDSIGGFCVNCADNNSYCSC